MADAQVTGRLLARVNGLAYGGDYNPEQWPERVWTDDLHLMREAGVTLVTVAVFGWAWLEPEPGRYEFARLDRVIEGLHGAGIAVDLATATASPPPWFSQAHPQTLPVDRDGRVLTYGSRQAFCPSSPVYREAALALANQLAQRYHDHPALAAWHVHNEYACHNAHCYCEVSAAAFRGWLQDRYGDLDGLNEAWGTAFWSQTYTDWAQVKPPRATVTSSNPGQVLDFKRFSSAEHLANFVTERDLLHERSPGIPITTNLMPFHTELDHWSWGKEMNGRDRFVSSDHYLVANEPHPAGAQIAYAADLSRSLADGGSWLLMEHSTSAVNWQPRNLAKTPGQLIRDSLSHVARGSEGAMFFQWRASRAGSEKWHSAMVPHAGTDSKVWREVVRLGAHLKALAEIDGSTVESRAAVLLDYPSGWAQESANQPSQDLTAFDEVRRWHAALWAAGVTADLAHPGADLSRYRFVAAPALYLIDDKAAENLRAYVAGGGTLLVGPYSGVVDERDQVRPAPMPGAFSDLLGVRVEEFNPLSPGESVHLDSGVTGRTWTEAAHLAGADLVASYLDGPTAGGPALTRHRSGSGEAWYLGTRLADADLRHLLADLTEAAGAVLDVAVPPGVDAVRRRHADGRTYLFLINHGDQPARVDASGVDLLTGATCAERVEIGAGGVAVIRESRG
jgi:beta-galactosidase